MTRRPLAVAIMALCCAMFATTSAHAKKHKQPRADSYHCVSDNDGRQTCGGAIQRTSGLPRASESGATIVSHPAGCPRRLFCGCGVSVKVFGRPVRDLYLAANWLRKFPRAEPGSGMVAARSGHVMYIMAYNGDGTALVYDPNSGRHLTRIHTRSLRGYRVVNPHGSRLASR